MARLPGLCLVFALALLSYLSFSKMSKLVGAPEEISNAENSLELEDHAKFAVDEHNRQNPEANLSFKKLLNSKKQVVAGSMYHLILEAESKGSTNTYAAKVWTKDWENGFKELKEFKLHSPDTGVRTVPVDDPAVLEAAEHALSSMQSMSNSLFPYELQHVVDAQAEVTNDQTNLDLVLKVKRGQREEHVKAVVYRAGNGQWAVKHANLVQL